MRTQRVMGLRALAIGLVLCGTVAPVWADDMDGDGVDDAIDVCSNTPPGTAVDAEGRPLGDIDQDCDTDMDDFALFRQGLTGPLAPLAACCCPDGTCVRATESDCAGVWQGEGTSCDPNPCIPPGMVCVPAGEFEMGDSFDEGDSDERPVHTVYLSPYYIDTYEVTNQQYCDGLNWAYAQGGLITVMSGVVFKHGSGTSYWYCHTATSSHSSRITWNGSTFGIVAGKESHPMVRVNWYGSVAYCNWRSAMEGKPLCYDLSTWTCDFGVAGYRLPTEAEWAKAAGWDPDQRRHFRFGEHTDGCGYNCLDGQRANYGNRGDPYEFDPRAFPYTTPVGFYNGELHYKVDFGWPGIQTSYQTQNAQSYYGCYDMSGSVWEWCHDWYSSTYYASSPGSNPTGPASGATHVLRGGNWASDPTSCRSANRRPPSPDKRYHFYGFRCASGTF